MRKRLWAVSGALCVLAMLGLSAALRAQAPEIKPKPPLYTYIADWQIPRANWGDVDKIVEPIKGVLDQSLSDGTITGYGSDVNLVHQLDAPTHSTWWSAPSFAGILKALDRIHASGVARTPVLNDAKHWDEVLVSRYYNSKSGSYKDAYIHVGLYKLKADAPEDAIEHLSEHLVVPELEKLLADGTIVAYSIDTLAIHTEAPGTFAIVYFTPTADGLDTVQAAVRGTAKDHPLGFDAFDAFTDDSGHRDELVRTDATFK